MPMRPRPREADRLLAFLGRLAPPPSAPVDQGHPLCVVHGTTSNIAAHAMAQSVGGLSVAGPFCTAVFEFDAIVALRPEGDLSLLVAQQALSRLAPAIRRSASRPVRIAGRKYRAFTPSPDVVDMTSRGARFGPARTCALPVRHGGGAGLAFAILRGGACDRVGKLHVAVRAVGITRMADRRSAIFLVNLVQDITVLRPLMHMARDLDFSVVILVSSKFSIRDLYGIWWAELDMLHRDLERAARGLRERLGRLPAPRRCGRHLCRQRIHPARACRDACDLSLRPAVLPQGHPPARVRMCRLSPEQGARRRARPTGVVRRRLAVHVAAERLPDFARGVAARQGRRHRADRRCSNPLPNRSSATPRRAGWCAKTSIRCASMRRARPKAEFVRVFSEFCALAAPETVVLRPHPGGQYVLKHEVAVPANVRINNAPMYRVDLRRLAYGISAPSSVLVDMMLADIPTAVWRDRAGEVDADNYAGLASVSTPREWLEFAREARARAAALHRPAARLPGQAGNSDRAARRVRALRRDFRRRAAACATGDRPARAALALSVRCQRPFADPASVPGTPARGAGEQRRDRHRLADRGCPAPAEAALGSPDATAGGSTTISIAPIPTSSCSAATAGPMVTGSSRGRGATACRSSTTSTTTCSGCRRALGNASSPITMRPSGSKASAR